jgi:hypothetical protein
MVSPQYGQTIFILKAYRSEPPRGLMRLQGSGQNHIATRQGACYRSRSSHDVDQDSAKEHSPCHAR